MTSSVDVVIVTYNAAPVLAACLAALRDQSRQVNVIVADNGSSDDTISIARAHGTNVVELGANVGFGAACNAGALAGSAPAILFLNPDALTTASDTLRVAKALEDIDAGVIGVRLVQADGSLDHAAKRMVIPPFEAGAFLLRRSEHSRYLAPHVSEFEIGEVDAVNGAYMMLKRSVFEAVGGFDLDYWMYIEDIDLCWRVKSLGKPVVYWPLVTAVHLKSATSGRSRNARLNYHLYRSSWIFYRKHQAGADGAFRRLAVLGGLAARCGWVICRDSYRRRRGVGRPLAEFDPATMLRDAQPPSSLTDHLSES